MESMNQLKAETSRLLNQVNARMAYLFGALRPKKEVTQVSNIEILGPHFNIGNHQRNRHFKAVYTKLASKDLKQRVNAMVFQLNDHRQKNPTRFPRIRNDAGEVLYHLEVSIRPTQVPGQFRMRRTYP